MRRISAEVRRRSPRGVILLYHRVAGPRFDPLLLDVSPENFAAQMNTLQQQATVLALDEFESLRREGKLPVRAAAVTFDDGYADNFHAAAPLLARHGVPATVFVVSGMVGARGEFWWDDIERAAFAGRPLPAAVPMPGIVWPGDRAATIPTPGWSMEMRGERTARQVLYQQMVHAVRLLDSPQRTRTVATLREWAGVDDTARESHRSVTADELRALGAAPGITIGAHTVSHPVLASLDEAEQRREMAESRAELERMTGAAVSAVAYPNGTSVDVSGKTARAAREAGFSSAYVNEPSCAWRGSSRWRVPRILVRDWDATEFARRLAGWWTL